MTFLSLYERIQELKSGQTNQQDHFAKKGFDLSPTFWENLNSLLSDLDGASDFFGVDKTKIISWSNKIKDLKQEKPGERDVVL